MYKSISGAKRSTQNFLSTACAFFFQLPHICSVLIFFFSLLPELFYLVAYISKQGFFVHACLSWNSLSMWTRLASNLEIHLSLCYQNFRECKILSLCDQKTFLKMDYNNNCVLPLLWVLSFKVLSHECGSS